MGEGEDTAVEANGGTYGLTYCVCAKPSYARDISVCRQMSIYVGEFLLDVIGELELPPAFPGLSNDRDVAERSPFLVTNDRWTSLDLD